MEMSMLLDNEPKYSLPPDYSSANVSDEAFLRQSAVSLPFNFNVFVSSVFADLLWPVNSTGLENVPQRTLLSRHLNSLSPEGSSLINISNSNNVNLSSVLDMFSTLRPLNNLLPDEETLSRFGRYNDPRTPGDEGWLLTLVWSLLFYPMVVLAAAGNLLVIWIISTKPLMRTVMNRYLLNLTVSDFLSVTFNASFNFVFMINEHWPFGKLYCIVNNFVANLTIASSVWTLMLISMDRYYAIVHPLRPRQSHRRLLCSIGAIWVFSALFSIPTLLYSDTLEVSDEASRSIPSHQSTNSADTWLSSSLLFSFIPPENSTTNELLDSSVSLDSSALHLAQDLSLSTRTLCILRWPDGVSGFSTYEFMYNLAFLILFYVVPLFTMVVALILMSRVLWPGERIGEHTTLPQHALIRSKRKVVCMLICVITVFGVCWLPYHTYFISIYLWPSLIQTLGIKHIFLAFYWFAMANSLFNPIILFAMNRRIRNYIIYYLKFTCCLFGLHKRFSRNCRRSSLQIMMKKGVCQLQYQQADSVQCQVDMSNRPETNKFSHYRHKRCGFGNESGCVPSDDESSSRQINPSYTGHKRKSARYNAIHQECSSSSINSQSNQSYSTNRRFLLRKSPNRGMDDDSQWNHSCPPIICSPQEVNSVSSCSYCTSKEDRSTNWPAICRCGSNSGPSGRAVNASSCSTYNSLSCANLDRLYSITQNDDFSRAHKSPNPKPSSRFRLFTWRQRHAMCPVHLDSPAVTLSTSVPSSQAQQTQRRSNFCGRLTWDDANRSNTAL